MANDIQLVVTGKVRLSYEHLFKPYSNDPKNEPKYSTTVLVPKSDFATKQRMDAAIAAAIANGVTSKWNGVRPPQVPIPVHDGDGVRPSDGMPFGAECKGHWVFTASCSTSRPPQVVDANLNPIIQPSEVYSGIYARVSCRFYPYINAGKKGIGCGLNNVQKLEDGESLGGGTTAQEDFGAMDNWAAPAGYPATAQPGYPVAAPPGYPAAGPTYPGVAAAQPGYPVAAPAGYPTAAQPTYPTAAQSSYSVAAQPVAAPAINPITGKPAIGNILGL